MALAVTGAPRPAIAATEQQSLEELRNTVINLLQALVDQGVMPRAKAEALVKQAQEKAASDSAERDKEEAGAVRVTFVPEVVKDEIRKQVAADLRTDVTAQVVSRAKEEKWGVPAALPDWLTRVRWSGDVRLRGEAALLARDNLTGAYLDFQTINLKGGITRAGIGAYANVSEDRYRMRVRARLGLEADLVTGLSAGIRLSTGSLGDPGTANQTLGVSATRYTVGFDQIYLRWDQRTAAAFPWLTLSGGRIASPWLSTDLLFHRDLNFEGVAGTFRAPLSASGPAASHLFLTLGAHPVQELELTSKDKWLLAAQLGADLRFGDDQRLRLAAAFYDYLNTQGRRNSPDSPLLDYTAPQVLQRGNTVFDIRNDLDVTTNLFALAGKYRLVDVIAAYELPIWGDLRFSLLGDYVRNVGWKSADVLAVSQLKAEPRTTGYQLEAAVGHANALAAGRWRAYFTYRYLQRDAVLDAFTDTDFRGGGTDVKGYIIGADVGLARNTWLRARYMAADAIDGTPLAGYRGAPIAAPFGLDLIQLDLNAQF